jgi:lipoprotein-releasing system ATP-binding protein
MDRQLKLDHGHLKPLEIANDIIKPKDGEA